MSGACHFDLAGEHEGKFIYTCRECHRSISLAATSSKIYRVCSGQVPHDPDSPVVYVAFWPKEPTTLYGVQVRPWTFVYVQESWLVDLPYSYEIIENDASYFGTRLKELFTFLGYDATENSGCQCSKLANALDTVSLDFIERHRSSLADQIVQSASQRSVSVSHGIIDRLIGFVLWKERRRVNQQKSLPKHSE